MDAPLDAWVVVALCVVAFIAGGVDAIAGGGGLLTVPALLTAGLPPHLALGTNKGQSVFGAVAALGRFIRAGLIEKRRALTTFPAGFVGSLLGALLLVFLEPAVLRPLVLVLLVFAGVVVGLRRPSSVSPGPVAASRERVWIEPLCALVIGAYDGFFGPGTGTFLILAFVSLVRLPLERATAEAKVVNFASNLAAVVLFASKGLVLWRVALPMAMAQFVGGLTGAHIAVRGGAAIIRKFVLGVVGALVLKLAHDLLGNYTG
jgi:uncharacterized membrane protein YfcA